jgi:hypothetical protein
VTPLCKCGCGKHVTLITHTNTAKGLIKGRPRTFIKGHHSRLITGADHPNWRGGINHHGDGYIFRLVHHHPYANQHGYVAEHRLVMEAIIGRYLAPDEIVHHKNHDPSDNHPENLSLESRSSHAALHGNFPKPCRIIGCDRKHKRQTLCDTHAKYAERHRLSMRVADLPSIPRRTKQHHAPPSDPMSELIRR